MNTYFSKEICNIIKDKLSVDYKKYKMWCCTEGKWVYIWKSCDIVNFKCPNENNHEIYSDFISIINCIKSNGKIILLDKIKIIDDFVTHTQFEIIDI